MHGFKCLEQFLSVEKL